MNKLGTLVCDGCGVVKRELHDGLCDSCFDNINGKVNNFDKIYFLLEFTNKITNNYVYLIQVIQRKKDGTKQNIVKNYYISDTDDFLLVKDEIMDLCKLFNARAYIQLNPIESKTICFELVEKYLSLIKQNNYDHFEGKIASVIASNYIRKYFLVDIDKKDYNSVSLIKYIISNCKRNEFEFFCEEIPTVSGWHLIVHPFDIKQFNQQCLIEQIDNIEIKKQAMTLLYCDLRNI